MFGSQQKLCICVCALTGKTISWHSIRQVRVSRTPAFALWGGGGGGSRVLLSQYLDVFLPSLVSVCFCWRVSVSLPALLGDLGLTKSLV